MVQERDADRQAFAEQQRAHASERQRIEERAAATERRLLEDIDRSRQDAKATRNALADAQRQQELLRGEVQTLTERNHHTQLEIAALTERLAASSLRESGLSQALQDLRTAANQPAAPASRAGRRTGARKRKV